MKKLSLTLLLLFVLLLLVGCDASGSLTDKQNQISAGNKLAANQPTPTDIDYSLERYNIIRRMYWINGQREKARNLPCPIEKPLGYIVLLTQSGAVVGRFIVDGKVTSLNNFMTPISEYYEAYSSTKGKNEWLPDIDGCYGYNVEGVFFFTTNGNYIEWTGLYIYSDIPFQIEDPVIKTSEA